MIALKEPVFLTEEQAADVVHLSEGTLANWRRTGTGPPTIRVGPKSGKILYDREELIAWVRAQGREDGAA